MKISIPLPFTTKKKPVQDHPVKNWIGVWEYRWQLEVEVPNGPHYLLSLGVYQHIKRPGEDWRYAHESYFFNILRRWSFFKDDMWYDGAFHIREYGLVSFVWSDYERVEEE